MSAPAPIHPRHFRIHCVTADVADIDLDGERTRIDGTRVSDVPSVEGWPRVLIADAIAAPDTRAPGAGDVDVALIWINDAGSAADLHGELISAATLAASVHARTVIPMYRGNATSDADRALAVTRAFATRGLPRVLHVLRPGEVYLAVIATA